MMKKSLIMVCIVALATIHTAFGQRNEFFSSAARQAVAVDNDHLYVIENSSIVKYTKDGDSISMWRETEGIIQHLNSGIVIDGQLYCAHSNYPNLPMTSSIEIFDTNTMQHCGSISFGINVGSCTWIVTDQQNWFVFFAHYNNRAQLQGCDVSYSQLVKFDKNFTRLESWVLPQVLIDEVAPYSLSGAIYLSGKFYTTGHDAQKLYILELPTRGSELKWVGEIDVPFAGQGIAFDPQYPNVLYGINKSERKVIRHSLTRQ